MTKRLGLFFLFLISLSTIALYPDNNTKPEDDDIWYIYDAKNKECKLAVVGDSKISLDLVINTYNCKVIKWSFEDRWIIIGCNTRQINGFLLFTREMKMCEEVRSLLLQTTSI